MANETAAAELFDAHKRIHSTLPEFNTVKRDEKNRRCEKDSNSFSTSSQTVNEVHEERRKKSLLEVWWRFEDGADFFFVS